MSNVTTVRTFPEYYAGKSWTLSQAENSLFDLEEQCQQVKNEIRKHEMEAQEKIRQHLVQQRKLLCCKVDAFMESKRREISRLRSTGNLFQPEVCGNSRVRHQSDCNLNGFVGNTQPLVSVEFDRVDLNSLNLDSMTLGKLNISDRGDRPEMTRKSHDEEDDTDEEDSDSYINMSNQKTILQRQRAIDARRAHIRNAGSGSTDGQSSIVAASSKPSGVASAAPDRRENYENLWESGASGRGRQNEPDSHSSRELLSNSHRDGGRLRHHSESVDGGERHHRRRDCREYVEMKRGVSSLKLNLGN